MSDEYQINANITADATGFEAGIDKAVSGSGKLEKSLEQTEKNLSKSFENISKSAAKLGTVLSVGVTLPIVALGKKFMESSGAFQAYQVSFETMLGSAEKAASVISQLQNMAAKTPFELTGLANATKTLLQFNVAQEEVLPVLRSIGDIAQGNNERLQRLSLAFAQSMAAGRLMGQDLLQMVNAGFNPLQEISKKTGQSLMELRDIMANGGITTQMITDAFKAATSEGGKFYQGMEKASKTLTGLLSTLNDDFMTMGRSFTDALLPAAMELVKTLSNMAKWVTELPEPLKKTITQVLLLAAALGPLALAISAVTAVMSILAAHPVILALAAAAAAVIALNLVFNFLTQKTRETKKATDDLVATYGDLEDSQQRRIRLAREELAAMEDSAQRRARLEREAKDKAAADAKEKEDADKKAAEAAKKLAKEVAEAREKAEKDYQTAMQGTKTKLDAGLISYSESVEAQKSATEDYINKLIESGDTNSKQLLAAIQLWKNLTTEINIANEAISKGAKADSDRLAAKAKDYQDSKQAMTAYNALIQVNGKIAEKYGHEKIKLDDLSMYNLEQIIELTKNLQAQIDFQKSEELRLIDETAADASEAAEENSRLREKAAKAAIDEVARVQAVDNMRLEAAARGYLRIEKLAEGAAKAEAQAAIDAQADANAAELEGETQRISRIARANILLARMRVANYERYSDDVARINGDLTDTELDEYLGMVEFEEGYRKQSIDEIADEAAAAAEENTKAREKSANDAIAEADRVSKVDSERLEAAARGYSYLSRIQEEKRERDKKAEAKLVDTYTSYANIRVANEKEATAKMVEAEKAKGLEYVSLAEWRIAQEKAAEERALVEEKAKAAEYVKLAEWRGAQENAAETARMAALANQYSTYAGIRTDDERKATARASLYAQGVIDRDLESKKSTLQKEEEAIQENLEKELALVGNNENAKKILIKKAEIDVFKARAENLNKYVRAVGDAFAAIGGEGGKALSKLSETVTNIVKAVSTGDFTSIVAAITSVISLAGDVSSEKFEALQKSVGELAEKLMTALAPILEVILDALQPIVDILIILSPLFGLVAEAVSKVIKPIVDLVTWIIQGGKWLWNWIKSIFGANKATEQAVKVDKKYADALKDVNKELKENKELFTKASNSGNAYTIMLTKMRQKIADFYAGLQNIGTDIADKLIANLTEGLTESDFLTTMKKYITNLVIQAAVFTAEMSTKIASIGQMIAEAIANGTMAVDGAAIAEQLRALYQSASTAAAAASQVVGEAFSGYATGTRSATAGMHKVAESGPELVMNPSVKYLNQGARVFNAQDTAKMMGGNSITSIANFNSPKALSPYEMRKNLRQYNRSIAFKGGF